MLNRRLPGLAALTKGTALIWGAPILAAALAPLIARPWKKIATAICVIALCVAFVNAPFQARYFRSTGGHFASFGLNNDPLSLRATLSNMLRNGATELGSANTAWDRDVYRLTAAAHRKLRIPLNDPATTYWGCAFGIPQSSMHEALAPNLAHTLLLMAAFPPLAWYAGRWGRWALLYAGIFAAFVLLLAEFLLPRWAQAALIAFSE